MVVNLTQHFDIVNTFFFFLSIFFRFCAAPPILIVIMKVLLIGDECIDKFVYGNVDRINPESPTPIFDETNEIIVNKGMAGNVLGNINSLSENKIEIISMVNDNRVCKTRYVDKRSGQILLRVDSKPCRSDSDSFNFDKFCNIVENQNNENNEISAIVVADYNKGFLSCENIEQIISIAKKYNIPTFFDTKKTIDKTFYGADFIKINQKEHLESSRSLNMKNGYPLYGENYIITLGKDGCIWYNHTDGTVENIAGHNVEVSCVSGAGDTVMAALVVKYLETKKIKESLNFAMLAASEAVKHRNVVSVARHSIEK